VGTIREMEKMLHGHHHEMDFASRSKKAVGTNCPTKHPLVAKMKNIANTITSPCTTSTVELDSSPTL